MERTQLKRSNCARAAAEQCKLALQAGGFVHNARGRRPTRRSERTEAKRVRLSPLQGCRGGDVRQPPTDRHAPSALHSVRPADTLNMRCIAASAGPKCLGARLGRLRNGIGIKCSTIIRICNCAWNACPTHRRSLNGISPPTGRAGTGRPPTLWPPGSLKLPASRESRKVDRAVRPSACGGCGRRAWAAATGYGTPCGEEWARLACACGLRKPLSRVMRLPKNCRRV